MSPSIHPLNIFVQMTPYELPPVLSSNHMSAFHRRDPKVKCGDWHDLLGIKAGLQCLGFKWLFYTGILCPNNVPSGVYTISEC